MGAYARFQMLLKHTAFRLSVLYLVLFAACAAALVLYVTSISESQLQSRMRESVSQEVADLNQVYEDGGISALLSTLEKRSRQPGANLYVIAGPNGEMLAGNVGSLAPGVLDEQGWTSRPFLYNRFGETGSKNRHVAIANILVLDNGLRILVGRDLGEPENARLLVRQALMLALGIMAAGALLIWFMIGRNAMRRLDRTALAAQKIVAGDLSQRLPISGSGDEFDRLSDSLNVMLARMERLNEGLRQVSDNIAHDLKTPLTRLRNKAESALAGERSAEDYRNSLEEIIGESDQLIRTFNALLMISRVEAGSAAAEMNEVDLTSVAREFLELYEPVAEDAGMRLEGRIADALTVRGNRELIAQAIANLIDNAIKYGENAENPLILLSACREGETIVIEIADHGIGIAEEKHAEVVKRFVRLDESRSKPGTGLGLSLALAVMELHGGRIEFGATDPAETAMKGLTVRMLFPA
ncbi:MAG: hypothetical protein RLZZ444_902 [Pseudomonadota bacterium]|jgi:signal transduction histidine kinase